MRVCNVRSNLSVADPHPRVRATSPWRVFGGEVNLSPALARDLCLEREVTPQVDHLNAITSATIAISAEASAVHVSQITRVCRTVTARARPASCSAIWLTSSA